MCGIAGILSQAKVNASSLVSMTEAMAHRGPDDEGYFLVTENGSSLFCRGEDTIREKSGLRHVGTVHEPLRLGLSHRRLSIIDLSPSGHQPMTGARDLTIVFNGEIYNYIELREELKKLGHQFLTDSDTEVILISYQQWGASCVEKFRGMWAFALHDGAKKELFLSRDRFGIKPFYYVSKTGFFAFASEIKALFRVDGIKPRLQKRAFLQYVTYGATDDSAGILFEDVRSLPPGHNMTVSMDTLQCSLTGYYRLEDSYPGLAATQGNETGSFRQYLNASLDLHLRSDVPVGVCLSGGLDSSYIASYIAGKISPAPMKSFTAAYHVKNIDESPYAVKVCDQYRNIERNLTYPGIRTFWDEIDRQIYHHDLPFHSTSMFAQWEVFKLAQEQGIKVVMNGQGSDELLGGYYNNAGIFLIDLMRSMKLGAFLHEYRGLKENFSPHVCQDMARAAYAFLPSPLKQFARQRFRIGANYLSADFRHEYSDLKPPDNTASDYRRLCIRMVYFGLQQLLRYEDRISMAFSIESRVPFLDHPFAEFCIGLDSGWKYRDGWSKYILRQASVPIVPKEVVWRKDKMGFLTPQAQWRRELHSKIAEYVAGRDLPPMFDRRAVDQILEQDLSRPADLSAFWSLIILLKWFDVFNVSV